MSITTYCIIFYVSRILLKDNWNTYRTSVSSHISNSTGQNRLGRSPESPAQCEMKIYDRLYFVTHNDGDSINKSTQMAYYT